ncbi:MAG TPA: outer membrane protein transport protein, partial [Thermoanaerobaculia bacterium]|nr:outer membrane protein transport protein [Thermoanaerobaculia bacterium]
NFSNPGARSLALGGAFTGLADDATAAYTNPAGLTILQKPEASIEARSNRFTHVFTNAGNSGTPTGIGVDNIAGLQTGRQQNRVSDLSFASFVIPKEQWAIAFYTHQVADFKANFNAQGAFIDGNSSRFFPTSNRLDLSIRNYAIAFAVKLPASLSLGLSANYLDFNLNSTTKRYDTRLAVEDPACAANITAPGCFNGPALFDETRVVNAQTQRGSGNHRITFNAGLIFRPSSKFNLGFVIRDGARFRVEAQSFAGAPGGGGRVFRQDQGYFHVPTVIGVGVVIRPVSAFTLAADVNRIQYGSTGKNFAPLFGEDPRSYKASDGNEYHLGAEYAFTQMKYPILIRAGGWRDPEHRIRFADDTDIQSLLFRRGERENHYSAGLGIVFGPRLELNAGYDHSNLRDTASLSLVTRFR